MAKQNFLAGGYYGKLGATVGQRWKNQRTLRTYVIPENPRTPKQMANRNKFTAAVPFAQKGMSMNYRSPAFASETTTEWALRMSSAKYAMDLGQSDVAAIPVVPRGFTSAYTITGITVSSVTDATHAKLLLTGSLPAGAKHYSLMIYFSDGSRVGEYMLCHGETTAADTTDLTITCEDTTDLLTATLYGVIVSNDDIDAQTVTYSARVAIEKAAKPAFDMTITSATVTNLGNGKLHAAINVGFDGSDLVGTFNAANVVLNGECFTKAAIYENGDESGISMTAFSNVAGTVSAFTFDRANKVIEFDIAPANASDVYKYGSTTIAFDLTWTDAYTDETSLSSGSVSGSPTFAGGYINGQYADFSVTVQSVNITRPTLGKVHAVATLGFAGSGLKGAFSVSGVTVGGTVLTKANVFAAGGESGATATTISNIACTVSNITQNLSLGTVEFDITPSNVADIQKFNSVTFNATITFANAWTSNTLKKSGSANGAGTWANGYLQSVFTLGNWDIDTLTSDGSIDPVFDMQGHWLGYCWSKVEVAAWLDASADALKALYDINQLHPTTSASFNPLGRLYVEDEDGNDYQSSTLEGSDFTCEGEDEPTHLEVRYRFDLPNQTINLQLGNVANTVATLLNESNNRFGIYDADHIWTALPTMQFSGDLEF